MSSKRPLPHPASGGAVLVNGDLSPANAESVHVQLEELSRLSQIIEELLFLSRAERRKSA